MLNLLEESSTTSQTSTSSWIIMVVLIVAIIGLFVWQSISNKKKQKQAEEKVNQLKVGDRVKTIGGVCGFVVEINNSENTFVLETGTNDRKSCVKFDKAAIYQTAPANGFEDNKVETPVEEPKTEEVKETTEEVVTDTEKKAPAKRTRKKASADDIDIEK